MSHLDRTQTINLGSFYTPKNIVNIAYKMLESRLDLHKYLLLDSACGNGDFFIKDYKYLGVDIDKVALQFANFATRFLDFAYKTKLDLLCLILYANIFLLALENKKQQKSHFKKEFANEFVQKSQEPLSLSLSRN